MKKSFFIAVIFGLMVGCQNNNGSGSNVSDTTDSNNDKENIAEQDMSLALEGERYMLEQEWDKALETLEKAQKQNPKDARIAYNVGFVQMKKEKPEEAITSFSKAIELDEKMKEAYFDKAIALKKIHKLSEAAELLEKAVKKFESDGLLYVNLADTYEQMREYEKALKNYRKVKEVNSEINVDDNIRRMETAIKEIEPAGKTNPETDSDTIN